MCNNIVYKQVKQLRHDRVIRSAAQNKTTLCTIHDIRRRRCIIVCTFYFMHAIDVMIFIAQKRNSLRIDSVTYYVHIVLK